MKKSSRKDNIKACKDLWTFLAQNPMSPKYAYPPFLEKLNRGNPEGLPLNGCYACEDAKIRSKQGAINPDCSKCFLLELWKEGLTPLEATLVEEMTGDRPCTAFKDSPFRKWHDTTSLKNRTKCAWEIVDFCTKLLEEK